MGGDSEGESAPRSSAQIHVPGGQTRDEGLGSLGGTGGRTSLSQVYAQRLLMCWHNALCISAFRTALVSVDNICSQVGVLGECSLGTRAPMSVSTLQANVARWESPRS